MWQIVSPQNEGVCMAEVECAYSDFYGKRLGHFAVGPEPFPLGPLTSIEA